MTNVFMRIAAILTAVFLIAGCSDSPSSEVSEEGKSEKVNKEAEQESSDEASSEAENQKEVIRHFLELEFTGPVEELSQAYELFYSDDTEDEDMERFEEGAKRINDFLEENYKPLLPENKYEAFINGYALDRTRSAFFSGYELQPKEIHIEQVGRPENQAYTYEVVVEYSKNGETNTTTATGRINMSDNGKISKIVNIDDGNLDEGLS